MKRLQLIVSGLLLAASVTCSQAAPLVGVGSASPVLSPSPAQNSSPVPEEGAAPTRAPTPTYLPLVAGSMSPAAFASLIQPEHFTYLGAFRLPEGGERPLTFAYGGSAMTFNPSGDPGGPADGFPGSLFISGHDRLPYGELPDGSQVAEIDIPAPVIAASTQGLPQAGFLQAFENVAEGHFTSLDEMPRLAMQYLDAPATGPKIHLAWGQHLDPEPPVPTHAWFSPDLSAPDFRGEWYIGHVSPFSVNGYLLEMPAAWASSNTDGRVLGTGRFRDGGWSGMGPSLFAYRPWVDNQGAPAPDGARLTEVTLLHYASSQEAPVLQNSLDGYQHPDEWEGAAWLTTPAGRSAVLFSGTKSDGARYWYGYAHPAGPDFPCVDGDFVGQFPVCLLASGDECPPADLVECVGHNDYRGWWSSHFTAQFLLYDPAQLAQAASGAVPTWQPQPYARLDIDSRLFHNPDSVELEMLGSGVQRRYRTGEIAYDRVNGLLYVLELFADEARPVVHVWRVDG